MGLGSISFVQEPVESNTPVITNWTPIVPYTVYQDDISGLFYFKLILEVRLTNDSGEVIAKLKQRRNGFIDDITNNDARASFDLRDIVNSQLEDTIADQNSTTNTIHKLGANVTTKVFSDNYNQIKAIYVKAYQEYSSSASSTPSEEPSTSVNDTLYYIAASLPLETARGTQYFQGGSSDAPFRSYTSSFNTDKVLSNVEAGNGRGTDSLGSVRRNYVQDSDYHTIGFLNDQTNFQSHVLFFQIVFYNDSGALNTVYVRNNETNGGAIPSTSGGEVTKNSERLLYYGCGTANLEAQTVTNDSNAKPSNNSGWTYYTVRGTNTDSSPSGTDFMTTTYYFIKENKSCKGFKVRRLAWRNSFGCYDYFNFTKKSTQTVEVEQNNYQTLLGNFSSNMYSYDNFGRGKRTRQTTAMVKETLNTDWIAEEEAQLLETLIMSTNVQIVENADTDYTVPVLITDKSIVRKTQANDGVKIQYTINIEYANPLNTNS
tara:strand:- start:216 stop:1676 length:1461 start_codon:yes stop_codon:yes gene_type:complete